MQRVKSFSWSLAELELNTGLLKDKSVSLHYTMLALVPMFLFVLYYHPPLSYPSY